MWLNKNIHTLSSQLSFFGVEDAIISPGSRNAPLTVALARNPHIHCTSIVDERSAGFIALGMAKANNKPVVLCCTSGTALLNYYPAIAEAYYSGVSLIILSADRPPELIDNWDGQCIRQEMVFENHIQGSYSLPSYTDKEDCTEEIEEIIYSVMETSLQLKGPVHLNIPLREPLYSEFPKEFLYKKGKFNLENLEVKFNSNKIEFNEKTLLINGAEYIENQSINTLLIEWKKNKKVVVLNDIISNKFDDNFSIFDSFLLKNHNAVLAPEILITTGKFCLSKSLKNYLRKYKPAKHYHISENGGLVGDPFDTNPIIIESQLEDVLSGLDEISRPQSSYYFDWENQLNKHFSKVESFFEHLEYGEFKACHTIANHLPKKAILHLANSTSIRYFSYLKHLINGHEIHSNRGTSGIDGCTSTAVGFALATAKSDEKASKEHVLITGDIAFLYDSNALWLKDIPQNFKIIVLNNSGGGIFRYIDGPKQLPELEEFFETSHQRSAKYLANEFGLEYLEARNTEELDLGLSIFQNTKKCILLEVFTDKYTNEIQFNKFKEI